MKLSNKIKIRGLNDLARTGSFGGGIFRVNVTNGNEVHPEEINVTFQDVKGVRILLQTQTYLSIYVCDLNTLGPFLAGMWEVEHQNLFKAFIRCLKFRSMKQRLNFKKWWNF